MSFCPICENDRIQDFNAFGFYGPYPNLPEGDAVLCETHVAEAQVMSAAGHALDSDDPADAYEWARLAAHLAFENGLISR